jgi:hypothetical protein
MKLFIIAFIAVMFCTAASAQNRKTENVFIITLDGFRWQEMFGGADSALLSDPAFTRDKKDLDNSYGAPTKAERRKKLLPFFWGEIATKGQLYGNRWHDNKVNNANPYWFSYPGYNEIFTGYPDTAVNSNDKVWNKNVNVLEYLNSLPAYKNKVAAFASWDVFPWILNNQRSGVYVNAGNTPVQNLPDTALLNNMMHNSVKWFGEGVRPDMITYYMAKQYVQQNKPRVMYIAFDETDDFAHAGMYDAYLKTAHMTDALIADLWQYLQSTPQYQNKTTLIITTDHGRGDAIKEEWKHHGTKIKDAGEIWMAVLGPDTQALGELQQPGQYYQRQIATTIAAMLGQQFKPAHPVMEAVKEVR